MKIGVNVDDFRAKNLTLVLQTYLSGFYRLEVFDKVRFYVYILFFRETFNDRIFEKAFSPYNQLDVDVGVAKV